MYNLDKTYLKSFLQSPFIKEGAVEISQKLSVQIQLKKTSQNQKTWFWLTWFVAFKTVINILNY